LCPLLALIQPLYTLQFSVYNEQAADTVYMIIATCPQFPDKTTQWTSFTSEIEESKKNKKLPQKLILVQSSIKSTLHNTGLM
jgi:hypothetical protein